MSDNDEPIGFSKQINPRRKYSYSSLIKKKIANENSRESLFRATMVDQIRPGLFTLDNGESTPEASHVNLSVAQMKPIRTTDHRLSAENPMIRRNKVK